MVIVQGTLRLASAADRDRFLENALEGMHRSRAEKGCVEYVMAADPVEPDRVILSERWESMEDMDEHLQELGRRRREATPDASVVPIKMTSRDIWKYEVAAAQPLTF